jgi:hypothetical protein
MADVNDQGPAFAGPIIDPKALLDAVERQELGTDNPGFCVACGEERDGCEPDARKYPCESCGKSQVYGAMELLLMGYA